MEAFNVRKVQPQYSSKKLDFGDQKCYLKIEIVPK